MNEALNKQINKISEGLDKEHYDGFSLKKPVKEVGKRQIDGKQYIASPFFKNFFILSNVILGL